MMMSRWVGRGQPKEEEEERKEGRGRVKREYLGWGGGGRPRFKTPTSLRPDLPPLRLWTGFYLMQTNFMVMGGDDR